MTSTDRSKVAKIAADWWAERFRIEDKREAFREALRRVIAEYPHKRMRLKVDYDPWGDMLAAVRAAGVECSGILHSADGVLPRKTLMKIVFDPPRIVVLEGRGGVSADLDVGPP